MRNKHCICPAKLIKHLQSFCLFRRSFYHLVCNPGKFRNLCRNRTLRVNKGIKVFENLSVFHSNSANFSDPLFICGKSGRFQIEADKLSGKRPIAVTGYCRNKIVDKISLHPINHFNGVTSFFHIGGGIHCIRERLHNAVISNGNRRVSPLGRSTHQIFRRINAIHTGHTSM